MSKRKNHDFDDGEADQEQNDRKQKKPKGRRNNRARDLRSNPHFWFAHGPSNTNGYHRNSQSASQNEEASNRKASPQNIHINLDTPKSHSRKQSTTAAPISSEMHETTVDLSQRPPAQTEVLPMEPRKLGKKARWRLRKTMKEQSKASQSEIDLPKANPSQTPLTPHPRSAPRTADTTQAPSLTASKKDAAFAAICSTKLIPPPSNHFGDPTFMASCKTELMPKPRREWVTNEGSAENDTARQGLQSSALSHKDAPERDPFFRTPMMPISRRKWISPESSTQATNVTSARPTAAGPKQQFAPVSRPRERESAPSALPARNSLSTQHPLIKHSLSTPFPRPDRRSSSGHLLEPFGRKALSVPSYSDGKNARNSFSEFSAFIGDEDTDDTSGSESQSSEAIASDDRAGSGKEVENGVSTDDSSVEEGEDTAEVHSNGDGGAEIATELSDGVQSDQEDDVRGEGPESDALPVQAGAETSGSPFHKLSDPPDDTGFDTANVDHAGVMPDDKYKATGLGTDPNDTTSDNKARIPPPNEALETDKARQRFARADSEDVQQIESQDSDGQDSPRHQLVDYSSTQTNQAIDDVCNGVFDDDPLRTQSKLAAATFCKVIPSIPVYGAGNQRNGSKIADKAPATPDREVPKSSEAVPSTQKRPKRSTSKPVSFPGLVDNEQLPDADSEDGLSRPVTTTSTDTKRKRKNTGKNSQFFKPPTRTNDPVDNSPKVSPSPRKKYIPGTSVITVPPISAPKFGLFQERVWHEPFWLLVAMIFLNRTHGRKAAPVFWELRQSYPTFEKLAQAEPEDLYDLMIPLGLHTSRSSHIVKLARTWIEAPPRKGVRYRTLHYPCKNDGKQFGSQKIIEEDADDCSGALEIAHLAGCGTYAYDSWRIFCRDVLRGVALDFNGKGAPQGFVPEWQKVLPGDKELRACLAWMWLREGFVWDPLSGQRRVATEEEMEKARRGELEGVDIDVGGDVREQDSILSPSAEINQEDREKEQSQERKNSSPVQDSTTTTLPGENETLHIPGVTKAQELYDDRDSSPDMVPSGISRNVYRNPRAGNGRVETSINKAAGLGKLGRSSGADRDGDNEYDDDDDKKEASGSDVSDVSGLPILASRHKSETERRAPLEEDEEEDEEEDLQSAQSAEEEEEEDALQCPHCDRTFTNLHRLNGHQQVHRGKKRKSGRVSI